MSTKPTPRGRARTNARALATSVVCVVVAVAVAAHAQFSMGEGSGTYGGDQARSRMIDGERVSELIGNFYYRDDDVDARGDVGRWFGRSRVMEIVRNVIVRSDSLDLWADSLRVHEATGLAFAYGSVRIESEDGSIGVGDRARYDRDAEWLTLIGAARLIDGPNVIEGDSILVRSVEGTVESWGTVRVVDEKNRSVIDGAHAIFDQKLGRAVVDSLPFLRSRRGNNPMTTVISQWLAFDDSTEVSTAIGNVDFLQGDTQAHADTARFYGEDLLVLTGAPSVQQLERVMDGDEIRFVYEEGDLQRIEVFGNANLVDASPDTLGRTFRGIPLANTLSGDSLTVHVVDGDIVRTSVRGNASSVYLPDDQTTTISVNDVQGDAIDIHFVDNQVDAVDVRGNVKGIYRYLQRRTVDDLRQARESAADSLGAVADSLGAVVSDAPDDSLLVVAPDDSLAIADGDTVVVPGGRIDFEALADVVEYDGKATEFAVGRGRIHISDQARVKNGTLELFATDVYFDTEARELLAEGDPRLIDEGSELVGDRMGYLFDPQTGAVADGATRFDDGFYTISHARRIDKDTLLAEDAVFTQCDLEEPHHHFLAKRMKLKIGQTVVARQVTFYVSDIPLITLPFFYKDLKTGRRSGILFPQIDVGINSRQGRFIRDFGYYWATNEYTDFKFQMDFNERRNLGLMLENVYVKRYGFDGRARLTFSNDFAQSGQTGSRQWRITGNHNQQNFLDEWTLRSTYDLSSTSLTGDLTNLQSNTVSEAQLRSTARMSRTFDNGLALNLSLTRDQYPNRDDGNPTDNRELSRLTSGLSLSVPSRNLMSGNPNSASSWWENFLRSVNWTQSYRADYTTNDREASTLDEVTAQGNMSLSYVPKVQSAIQPRVTLTGSEVWTYTDSEQQAYRSASVTGPDGDTIRIPIADPENDTSQNSASTRPALSLSSGLQSTMYGVFPIPVGALRAMRHTAQFNVQHQYRPKLGDKQEESQNIALSWSNRFAVKVRDGEELDDEGNERTRNLDRLLTWDLRSNYDPDADPGSKWGDITSGLSLRPPTRQRVNFSMNQTIDPYSFEVQRTTMSADVGLSLRSEFDLGGVLRTREERKNRLLERLPTAEVDSAAIDSLRQEEEFDDIIDPDREQAREDEAWLDSGDGNRMPWNLNVSLTLNRTSVRDGATTLTARVPFRAGLSLPGAWRATYTANFDVDAGIFTTQRWTLERDLHHWRLEFRRESSGFGSNNETEFGFRLYLQPIQDISIDRGPLARGGGYGNRLNSF